MTEHLTKAIDALGMAYGDLREALGKASEVESIVLIDLIGQMAKAHIRAKRLRAAVGKRR